MHPCHEDLVELYKRDPEEFCVVTRKMIEDFIESIPNETNRNRCRGLQFRIDNELRHYHDPIARMNKMVELLWKGVNEFKSAIKGELEVPTHQADVIPFDRDNHN